MLIEFDYYTRGRIEIFGFSIYFYAICILLGGLTSLFITRTVMAKKGYAKEKIDLVFCAAFPSGIVGARIWYVIAEWGKEFSFNDFGQVFNFARGGLAVQGGVVIGIIVGVITLVFLNREKSYLMIADVAVPSILAAQAIGRLGNFFNHEVYGRCVSANYLNFLPDFIKKNVAPPGTCGSGEYALPLFLIEGLLNLSAFLILHFVVRRFYLKSRFYRNGDFVAFYFIWYGILRAILEPLRFPEFIMGSGIQISVVMSIGFIVIGIAILLLLRIHQLIPFKMKMVLFDLDGTILDNNQLIIDSYRHVFDKMLPKVKLTAEDEISFLGPSLEKTFSRFSNNTTELIEEYRKFNHAHPEQIHLFPGTKEIIIKLKEKGIKVGVVTTKSRDVAIKNIKQFGLDTLLDLVVGGDEVSRPKPSIQSMSLALKKANEGISFWNKKRIHRFNTIMIGDSQSDILAGKRSLMMTAGVCWSRKPDELTDVTPDLMLKDFSFIDKKLTKIKV